MAGRAVLALLLLLRFLSSILNPTLLDVPPEYASLYSLPILVGFVPYGWYPQTQSTGWSPIHSRTYPQMTLLVLLLLVCGDIHKNTLTPWTPVLSVVNEYRTTRMIFFVRCTSTGDTSIVLKCQRANTTTGPALKMAGSVQNVKRNPSHTIMSLSADACAQSSGVGSSGSQCSISHCNTPSSVLKLLSTNARSLLPKIDDLQGLCCHEHSSLKFSSQVTSWTLKSVFMDITS